MKCQEVIELMQRHLDQELTEDETAIMHKHIEQCEACSGMFARMAQLSEELVSLPKVVPAFSLVDQILPRLQEIDVLRSEGIKLDEDGRPLNEQPVPAHTLGWLDRLKQAATFKAVGGIAAAAVLLLAVFAAIQPIGSQDEAGEARLDVMDQSGASPTANEVGDMSSATSLAAKSPVVTSSGQAERGDRKLADSDTARASQQVTDGGAASPDTSSHSSDGPSPAFGEPPLEQASRNLESSNPLPREDGGPLFGMALEEAQPDLDEGTARGQQQETPAVEEPFYSIAEFPVVTSSAEVQRLDSSLSASGEWTAYVEESGGLYRLAVHETETGAALYVGAFMEMEDVPQLVWSEDEAWVILHYKHADESYRLAVNAQDKVAENLRE